MGSARADGVVDVRRLDATQRTELVAKISKARVAEPAAFTVIARTPELAVEMDKNKRGRFAPVGRHLRRLGKPALLPMLEMLAVQGPRQGNLTDSAWLALRVGLIEAVGAQREAIAQPVLRAILDGETDYWVVRAAAEAIGRYGDDAAAKTLIGLAANAGPKQLAVLSAIGDCRRRVVAEALADMVRKSLDAKQAKLVIDALGDVGNSWAWKTPSVSKYGEETSVRGTAAKALVAAFVKHQGSLRGQAQKAILLVDDASTPSLIAQARSGAPPATQAALDQLAQKFANNPLRR
jgi:hypothetical protein